MRCFSNRWISHWKWLANEINEIMTNGHWFLNFLFKLLSYTSFWCEQRPVNGVQYCSFQNSPNNPLYWMLIWSHLRIIELDLMTACVPVHIYKSLDKIPIRTKQIKENIAEKKQIQPKAMQRWKKTQQIATVYGK